MIILYLGGTHRVQRVPTTERSGRMHTSTAVVVILPKPSNIDIHINDKDIKVSEVDIQCSLLRSNSGRSSGV